MWSCEPRGLRHSSSGVRGSTTLGALTGRHQTRRWRCRVSRDRLRVGKWGKWALSAVFLEVHPHRSGDGKALQALKQTVTGLELI